MIGMSVGCKLTDRLTDIFTDSRVVALSVIDCYALKFILYDWYVCRL